MRSVRSEPSAPGRRRGQAHPRRGELLRAFNRQQGAGSPGRALLALRLRRGRNYSFSFESLDSA